MQLGLGCTQRMVQSRWLFRPGSQLYFLQALSPWLLCGFSCSQVTWMWEAPAQQAILCATGFLALGPLSSTLPVCPVTNHRKQQISAQTYGCLFLLLTTYQDDSV